MPYSRLSSRFTCIPCAYPQDLVTPPPPLPDRVAAALARAADLHNRTGDCTAALEAYDTAAALWRVAAAAEGAPYGGALSLTPEQEMWVWGSWGSQRFAGLIVLNCSLSSRVACPLDRV